MKIMNYLTRTGVEVRTLSLMRMYRKCYLVIAFHEVITTFFFFFFYVMEINILCYIMAIASILNHVMKQATSCII